MILRILGLLACLLVAACALESGPPDNTQTPRSAPHSSVQPGPTDFHPTEMAAAD